MADALHRSPSAPPRWRRAALWGLLIVLLGVAQTLLVLLALNYEATRAQDRTDAVASALAAQVRQRLSRNVQSLQSLLWNDRNLAPWRVAGAELLRSRRELVRIEQRDASFEIRDVLQSPELPNLFTPIAREALGLEAEFACGMSRRTGAPAFSHSYFVPQPAGLGLELIDLCLTYSAADDGRPTHLVASLSLTALLEEAHMAEPAQGHELSFVELDGARLARVGSVRGAGVYRAEQGIDLEGVALYLRVESSEGRPHLIPNLSLALVVGLSLALFALVILLGRDVRRRAAAEERLAEALAFRKAMEDSLVTGLRARDLRGRIRYVNPAFCNMVGFDADELQQATAPPYWPPERVAEYAARQAQRLGQLGQGAGADTRVGYETVFMRKNGERFPVMLYEAPLVDSAGRHSGWMSSALDVSDQRRMEELSRQQQERLQATARLATAGEMASLLSHELNQPLSAIASYASGSMNLLDDAALAGAHQTDTAELRALLRQSVSRIAEQAERAGRTIKSVHDFVRRREQAREVLPPTSLVDAVLPLVGLQARKSGTRIEVDIAAAVPRVWADRTMVEQVLLNLSRNAIQAMEGSTPAAARVLRLAVRPLESQAPQAAAGWVEFSVGDVGPGIAPEVAQRLFTPFFTTRSEGMGLGLSLCRTVIEQHGGALDFDTGAHGTTFRFTLRAAPAG